MKLNIIDGGISMELLDPQDILLDRYVNPWDAEIARRVTRLSFRSGGSRASALPKSADSLLVLTRLQTVHQYTLRFSAGTLVCSTPMFRVGQRAEEMNDAPL